MSRHRESNPHFDPSQLPQPPVLHPQQSHLVPTPHSPPPRHPHLVPTPHSPPPRQPHHVPTPHSPPPRQPHHVPTPPAAPPRRGRRQKQPPPQQLSPTTGSFPVHQQPQHQTQKRPEEHYPLHPIWTPDQTQHHEPQHEPAAPISQTRPHHPTQPVQPQHPTHQQVHVQPPPPHYSPPDSSPILPRPPKTRPHTWLIGVFCALFWLAVILGGVVVLIVYILFRPRNPKFDVASASLNAAYLDMGYLLNADMTFLANFTNPSKKATVDFSYMFVNLYFQNRLIATSFVEPFSALKAESKFRSVHLVSSQVGLSSGQSQQLQQQIANNRVRFDVRGVLKTRSNLGSLFRYSYRLYGHCIIEVTAPPSGILVGKKCTTKR
ncbi:hypothetical protein ACSBR2_006689 [Camellia fascicularis]